MSYKDLTWEEALLEGHKTLLTTHPRSPKKLIPPHQWIKETMKKNLGDGYEYYDAGETSSKYDKEYKVLGLFYDKMVDITVLKDKEVVGAISFKFVASNYTQNTNNYFENLLGKCYNLQSTDIPFSHVFITSERAPYFKEDKTFEKWQELLNHKVLIIRY